MTTPILWPVDTWEWFGNAGHFICASDCQFHLTTLVGPWLVSTVGQMVPGETVREIFAMTAGKRLVGIGDARLADYMKKVGYHEIGYGRTFETMVFRAGERCTAKGCSCGLPVISGSELEMLGYNDAGAATRGHMALCEKCSRLATEPKT